MTQASSLNPTQGSRFQRRPFSTAAVVIGVCAVAGVLTAIAPLPAGAFILLAAAALVAEFFMSLTGALVFTPVFLAFFLLNRFDEGWGLPVGRYLVKVNYWFALVVLGILAASAMLHGDAEIRNRPGLRAFLRWWVFALGAVILFGFLSSVFNAFFDAYVPDRSMLGEQLALGSLCVPMLFVVLIPLSGLSKRNTMMCIRLMTALAAGTGLIMVAFAVLPQAIVGMLGWARELGASGGMVRGSTPLGHANTVAAIQILFLPLAVTLGIRHYSAFWRTFYFGCAFFLLGGIAFSQSRTALVVAMPVVPICVFYLLGTRGIRRYRTAIFAVIFIGVLATVSLVLATQFDFSRFWGRQYYEEANVERRVAMVSTAARVLLDHPVLGASPNSVYPRDELDPKWVPPAVDQLGPIVFYRGRLTAANPHNVFLNIVAEYGVLGGSFVFSLFALVFLRLFRTWRATASINPFDHTMIAALGFSFCAFLCAGLGNALFLYSVRIGLIFWILMGLAIRYTALVKDEG